MITRAVILGLSCRGGIVLSCWGSIVLSCWGSLSVVILRLSRSLSRGLIVTAFLSTIRISFAREKRHEGKRAKCNQR